MTTQPIEYSAGFGEYQNFAPKDFKTYQSTLKTQLCTQSFWISATSIPVIAATIAFPPLLWVAPIALSGVAVWGVRSYLKYLASLSYFPPELVKELDPKCFQGKRVGETILENGSAIVLTNSVETQKYKLDLIRKAEQSIFFSCYMGNEALDETLDLIKEQLVKKSELRVFILGSELFVTKENKQRFDTLKILYPDRFHYVLTPEIYYSEHPSGGRSLLCTNHIKLMTIDQGSYMITGGSALMPYWTKVNGEEHITKVEKGFNFSSLLEAKGFRDMDFAFKCGVKGAGMTAFLEGAKLMVRYAYMKDQKMAKQLKDQFLQLMKNPVSKAVVPNIDTHPQRVNQLKMRLYATGPDHIKNSYLHELIALVNKAKEKIVIGQMFFHPPQSLMLALKSASERGIKIEIITNSNEKQTPFVHRFFSDMGQMTYQQLFQGKGENNVKVHAFYRANTTYHKKIVIVDDQHTALGSGNFGAKSLEENPADYEFNTIIDSQEFANKTMAVLKKDMTLSTSIPTHVAKNPAWNTRVIAWFQQKIMTHVL